MIRPRRYPTPDWVPVARWVWSALLLAIYALPLAIFWAGRAGALDAAGRKPTDALPLHLIASVVYLLLLTTQGTGWWQRRGLIPRLNALAFPAAIGTVFAWVAVSRDSMAYSGADDLGQQLAVWIIIYLAAIDAAFTGLLWVARRVRRNRTTGRD